MTTHNPTRRDFLITSLGVMAATKISYSQISQTFTAGDVIERIQNNLNTASTRAALDRFIAGNANMPVKGIATAVIATLDVIEQARDKGFNMIITHEPTFYSQRDNIQQFREDSVLQYKLEYIETNNIIIYRLYDQWLAHNPSGYAEGIMQLMGWENNVDPQNSNVFTFEDTILLELAKDIETKLGIKTMRVIGDPQMPVKRVAIGYGNTSLEQGVELISRDDVDVLIIGEANEWDVNEYAIDTYSSGKNIAVIYLGHLMSDVPGMKFCAQWLKGLIKEVPVEYINFPEPFWFADKPQWQY